MQKTSLSTNFEKIIGQKQNLYCQILIDGSGSINSSDFEGPLKTGVRAITGQLSGATIGVIQFSDKPVVEMQPTKDLNAVDKALRDMKQIGKGTNTKDAITEAGNYFRSSSAQLKVLFIITDGIPNAGQEPYAELEVLKAQGVVVYGLGIGRGVSEELMKQMSSNNLGFLINDYQKFMEFANLLTNFRDAEVYESPILEITFQCSDTFTSFEPITLQLELTNKQVDKIIDKGIIIKFHANKYFQAQSLKTTQPIVANSSIKCSITLTPQNNAADTDFPGKVKFEANLGLVRQVGWLEIPTGLLRGDYLQHDFGIPVNIMVIGKKGGGKSALFNCLVTALSKDVKPTEAFVNRPSSEHVTTEYSRTNINNFLDQDTTRGGKSKIKDSVPMFLYDIWGSSPQDFQEVTYKPFLQGRVKPGTSRDTLNKKGADVLEENANKLHMIHAVLGVIPLGAVAEPNTISFFNKALAQCAEVGHMPVVVVTQVDRIEDAEQREKDKASLLEQLSVDKGDVIFHSNYAGFADKKARDINIDINSRKIISALWLRAREFKLRKAGNEEDYWKDVQAKLATSPVKSLVKNQASPSSTDTKEKCASTTKPEVHKLATPKSKKVSRDSEGLGDGIDISDDELEISPFEDRVPQELRVTVVYEGKEATQTLTKTVPGTYTAIDFKKLVVKNRASALALKTNDGRVIQDNQELYKFCEDGSCTLRMAKK